MPEGPKKIFVFNENDSIYKRLATILSKNNFIITNITNTENVKNVLIEKQAKVVIVDPYSHNLFGFGLIEDLLKSEFQPVVLAMSEKRDAETIVKLIKSGVYDYIASDRDPFEIQHKILNACDAVEFQRLKKIHEKELRVLNGYFSVRKSNGKLTHVNQGSAVISSIRTSFTQGGGIGSLLTLISMITEKAASGGDKIILDKNLIQMLKENASQVKRVIDAFENLERLSIENTELEVNTLESVYEQIQKLIHQIQPVAKKYGKSIKINDQEKHSKKYVYWKESYLNMIIQELLYNAIKFSHAGSEIMVFLQDVNHGLLISVLNQPSLNNSGIPGIPEEYENLIFDPFFRLSRIVFEEIPTLDFGLGLTLVNLLVKKLNGSIRVSNLESYLPMEKNPNKLISMEIWFPIYNKKSGGYVKEGA